MKIKHKGEKVRIRKFVTFVLFVALFTPTVNGQTESDKEKILTILYIQISQDVPDILTRGSGKDKWAYEISSLDLYHVHICLPQKFSGDKKITWRELFNEQLTLLYHTKEHGGLVRKYSLPPEYLKTKRNIFHFPNGSWQARDNEPNGRRYDSSSVGLKDFTIYFRKTKKGLTEPQSKFLPPYRVDLKTIKKINGLWFAKDRTQIY